MQSFYAMFPWMFSSKIDDGLKEMMRSTMGDFRAIKFGAAEVQQLCSALEKKGKDILGVETLWLGDCDLGDDGVKALMATMRNYGSRLECLSLRSNSIGDAGVMALASSLLYCANLQRLYLGDNSIGEVGSKAVLESMP